MACIDSRMLSTRVASPETTSKRILHSQAHQLIYRLRIHSAPRVCTSVLFILPCNEQFLHEEKEGK